MMNLKFLYNMEKKFGKYAVKNLPLIIVACLVIGYLLNILAPEVYYYLPFSPYEIFYRHQYWRIFTWIFSNPGKFDFFTLVMLFFYYSIGTTMERTLGTFLFNVYVFGGMLITTISCILVSGYFFIAGKELQVAAMSVMMMAADYAGVGMTGVMLESILFCFALVYADSMVLMWMVIPIKVSYLAWIDLALLAYDFIKIPYLIVRVSIVASVANAVIFYFLYKKYRFNRLGAFARVNNKKRYKDFKVIRNNNFDKRENNPTSVKKETPASITRHKCAICGRSEKDDPSLEFRFCSKCNGNYEYCSDHLYTHEHVQ